MTLKGRVLLLCSLAVIAGYGSCGCVLFPHKAPPAAQPPQPDRQLAEAGREVVEYAGDVLAFVWGQGVEPFNEAVAQAHRSLSFIEALYGAPARRIPLVVRAPEPEAPAGVPAAAGASTPGAVHLEASTAADKSLDAGSKSLPDYRRRLSDWIDKVGAAAAQAAGTSAGPGRLLYWIGGIVLAVGIGIIILLKNTGLGLQVVAGGGVILGAGVVLDRYPWVLVLALVAGLALGGLALWRAHQGQKAETTVSALVKGVQRAPNAAAVKASIADVAAVSGTTAVVEDTVKAEKRRAGIVKQPADPNATQVLNG